MARLSSRGREAAAKESRVRRFARFGPVAAGVLAILGLAAGCHRAGDPVRETIDDLTRAANRRDAGDVADLLAPDFRAEDGTDRAEAAATVRRYFAAYEKLSVEMKDVTIERSEAAALVRFRADLSGKPSKIGGGVLEGLIPSNSSWQFELRLVPVEGKWKIAWATWTPAR
jgi:hypothetical protein